jgi:small subunit ribosomal protein S16
MRLTNYYSPLTTYRSIQGRSAEWLRRENLEEGPITLIGVTMVRIRLRRTGRKKAPYYRIVVADSQSPRDGRFIEIIGQYAPRQGNDAINLEVARANYWLDQGAQPSDTVRSLLRRAGVLKARHETRLGRKLSAGAVPLAEGQKEA